jgi:hypothetical protein
LYLKRGLADLFEAVGCKMRSGAALHEARQAAAGAIPRREPARHALLSDELAGLPKNRVSGKSPKVCPVRRAKIFCFRSHANQRHNSARLTHRGALAIVTDVRWDAMDAEGAIDVPAGCVR